MGIMMKKILVKKLKNSLIYITKQEEGLEVMLLT